MSVRPFFLLTCAALALASCARESKTSPGAGPLKLAGSTDFPGYVGDFDMFEIDAKDNSLLLAGEENHELEVMDLATGAIKQRVPGFGVPHSVHYIADTGELFVFDGEKPSNVYDAATLKLKRSYALPKGADTFGFDSTTGHVWLTSGGKDVPQKDSNITEIDPKTGKALVNVHLDSDHVETMAMDANTIWVNLTDKNAIAVIDKKTGHVLKTWPVKEAEQNAPMAIDPVTRRLFVVTRKPGKLMVINADSGATVASFNAPGHCDQVVWDAANRRAYVTGGEGYISVIEQDDADHYREAAKVPSMAGAKTAILDAAGHRLWVAASPGESGAMAKVLRFDVAPR